MSEAQRQEKSTRMLHNLGSPKNLDFLAYNYRVYGVAKDFFHLRAEAGGSSRVVRDLEAFTNVGRTKIVPVKKSSSASPQVYAAFRFRVHVSYSLNSSKGGYRGGYLGITVGLLRRILGV